MAKRKPCKPKPKIDWVGLYEAECKLAERELGRRYFAPTVNEAYIDRLYALTLGSPKLAHVLCPIHVK